MFLSIFVILSFAMLGDFYIHSFYPLMSNEKTPQFIVISYPSVCYCLVSDLSLEENK